MTAVSVTSSDLQTIATDVWTSFLATGSSPVVGEPEPPTGDDLVVGSILIHGAWRGRVTLELAGATAETVATVMFDGAVNPDDVVDAVGELVIMIGGNVKSLMPAPCTLGLPVVGRDRRAGEPDEVELCRADLSWDGAAVRVRVWQTPATPTNEGRDQP